MSLKTVFATLWCLFTVSMVTWWWVYGLNSHESSAEILRKHRMFMWEGSIFLFTVMVGGAALIFLSHRDQRRHEQLQTFFATFSHDIKTSITRLRLQAEVLEEDNAVQKSPVLERLIGDISRLDLQLENSLLLSTSETKSFLLETIPLSQLVESVRSHWSELEFRIHQDAEVIADRRAIISILRNLIQNAVFHGGATSIEFFVKAMNDKKVVVSVQDNGKGYQGDFQRLGVQMNPSASREGNGIGLFLSRSLLKKMNGQLFFEKVDKGFRANVILPGRLR